MFKVIEWLEKGMFYCELYCVYELVLIYFYNDEYKNVECGLMCLQCCVDDNYVEVIEMFVNVYFNGELVEENILYVCQLLERVIELGFGSVVYCIGWMYECGLFFEELDYQKVMEYYEKVVFMDSVDGYVWVVFYLVNGYFGVMDVGKLKVYYEKVVELGLCFVMVELVFLYENGEVVE